MQTFRIFGVPMDLGQRRRGVDMGPSALRYAGLDSRLRDLCHTVFDNGNLIVPLPENEPPDSSRARHLQSIAGVCCDVYEKAKSCFEKNETAIFLGGDHSISIGTVSAMTANHTNEHRVGMIWVDAHGDFNTPETTPSGNVHGMALAALLGRGAKELTDIGAVGAKLRSSEAVLIGVRDLDSEERAALLDSGILVITMRDVDEMGMAAATHQALSRLAHVSHIHISLDMDVMNPNEAPGVGTPVPGGLTYREAHLLMEILHDSNKISSLDIVEVNPILDEHNRTAQLGVELAASLFGQRIL
ncbi:MAG: arginase [Chloroflexi bacterium]|nr:arginase [Chloroflexota bacterium]MBI5714939.1 arginase [Chloroflexota bacterium]